MNRREFLRLSVGSTGGLLMIPGWMTMTAGQSFPLLSPAVSQSQTKEEWFLNTYRKLFFDYHTQSTAVEVAKGFDADWWADELVNHHVQAISLHSMCAYGWKYYRKGKYGWVHPNLPEDIDLVGEMVRACHERDIKVIGYFNVMGSEPIAEHHPEWLMVDKEGKRMETRVNLMSPYFEELLLPMLEEYTSNYNVDGIFFDFLRARISYDRFTQKKFKQATGKDLPKDSSNPDYEIFISWMLEEYKKMRQQVYDAVHRGRKRVLIAVNWLYTPRKPEVPPDDVGFLSLDVLPQDQVFEASYVAKYWVTLDKPFDIMNTAFLSWWRGWGVKPPASLKQECAATIANGGRTWIGYQYNAHYAVDPQLMDVYKQTFEFVKQREEYCKGAKSVPYIAVLHSTHGYFTHGPSLRADETRLKACTRMLLGSGFHFNIVNEATLLQSLDNYKLVILPDQRYLAPELVSALRKYVQKGGRIIASTRTGTQNASYESTGNFVLEDLLGVKPQNKSYPHDHCYINIIDDRLKKDLLDMPQQAFGDVVFVRPKGARKLAELWNVYTRGDGGYLPGEESPPEEDTGYPSLTVNDYGKGKAAYIAQDIFYAYNKRLQWNLKNLFRNLINVLIDDKLVEIEAPETVEVVLNQKDRNLYVNLINHYRNKRTGNSNNIAEEVIPVYDIKVKVKSEKPVNSITLVPENTMLEYQIKEGQVFFTIPKLHIHSIAVIKR